MMTLYYAEWEPTYGYLPPKQKTFDSDEKAVAYYKHWLKNNLLIVYKDSENNEMDEFAICYEKEVK